MTRSWSDDDIGPITRRDWVLMATIPCLWVAGIILEAWLW